MILAEGIQTHLDVLNGLVEGLSRAGKKGRRNG
jgi:hypothetical protein